jgi:RNA recognition motif-containing protein
MRLKLRCAVFLSVHYVLSLTKTNSWQELFHSTVGPLREVTLHYDSAGRSKGVAAVHFQRKGDGTKAYQQYNNRLIDGS